MSRVSLQMRLLLSPLFASFASLHRLWPSHSTAVALRVVLCFHDAHGVVSRPDIDGQPRSIDVFLGKRNGAVPPTAHQIASCFLLACSIDGGV
ncbi:MAG: hypothetical protein J3Q66DRAFT_331882 [Benniella sp.]|nr:MAG: hypothetical protein J3Q66DRAFT_331882 [Benniella sp.]